MVITEDGSAVVKFGLPERCSGYENDQPVGAMVMGLIAVFGGLASLGASFVLLWVVTKEVVRKTLAIVYGMLSIPIILMLLFGLTQDVHAGSHDSQRPAAGAFLAMAAIPLYLGAAVSTWRMKSEPEEPFPRLRGKLVTFFPLILAGIACVLAMVAVTNCDFVTQYYYYEGRLDHDKLGYITRTQYSRSNCEIWFDYSEEGLGFYGPDGPWMVGRAMGIIAGYGGFLVCIFTTVICCTKLSQKWLIAAAVAHCILGIASALMLIGLSSDICRDQDMQPNGPCEISSGVTLALVASVLYFGASFATLCLIKVETSATEMNGNKVINNTTGIAQNPSANATTKETAQSTYPPDDVC